jgi:hypothetical protein
MTTTIENSTVPEQWRLSRTFEDITISTTGQVKNNRGKILLRGSSTRQSFVKIRNSRQNLGVLICHDFYGCLHDEDRNNVIHLDNDKTNFNITNIQCRLCGTRPIIEELDIQTEEWRRVINNNSVSNYGRSSSTLNSMYSSFPRNIRFLICQAFHGCRHPDNTNFNYLDGNDNNINANNIRCQECSKENIDITAWSAEQQEQLYRDQLAIQQHERLTRRDRQEEEEHQKRLLSMNDPVIIEQRALRNKHLRVINGLSDLINIHRREMNENNRIIYEREMEIHAPKRARMARDETITFISSECPVCITKFDGGVITLKCGHLICDECRTKIDKCPVCRVELSERPIMN